ncbi:hypothetical protein AOLI_G00231990 [Acnodon oligacanthus]
MNRIASPPRGPIFRRQILPTVTFTEQRSRQQRGYQATGSGSAAEVLFRTKRLGHISSAPPTHRHYRQGAKARPATLERRDGVSKNEFKAGLGQRFQQRRTEG